MTETASLVLLARVLELFRRHRITCWLESGTLLSFVRDRCAGPCGRNVNIGIFGNDIDRVLALKRHLLPRYRMRVLYDRSGRDWINGNRTGIEVLPLLGQGRPGGTVLITAKFPVGDLVRWVDDRTCKQAPARFFERLRVATFDGLMVSVPDDAERYLTARYGDWKQPVTDWDTNRDDRAALDPAVAATLRRKTRWTSPERTRKKMRLVGRNLRRARRLLADTVAILERNNIVYWLDEGTLLGIVRDGELIPWDHDVDIAVRGDCAERLVALRKLFRPRYRLRPHRDYSGRIPVGALRAARVKFWWGKLWPLLGIEELRLDIFFKYRTVRGYDWIDSYTHKRVDTHFYDSLERVTYAGRQYFVPSDMDTYLTARFGNWRVPNAHYDSSIDDPAAVG